MGFIDRLTGRRAPPAGAVPQDVTVLRDALLDLNRETAPFVVRDGGPEGGDLVAEWRIVDARWYEIFAKAGIGKGAQVLLRLDADSGEVRSIQRDWTVEWRAGLPVLSFASEVFRGQKVELSLGTGWAFREEDLQFGKVYRYRFQTRELKEPLQEVTALHGWIWRPVLLGRL